VSPTAAGTVDRVPPTRLLLVRHGESTWNADGRWQGHADPPLSDLGRRQAKDAALHLGQVDLIVASDLQRASETASIIAAELGVGPVEVDEALRERAAGPVTGLTREEIDERFPGVRAGTVRPEGMEDDDTIVARAMPALSALEGRGDTVVVVTHGGLIGAVERSCGADHDRIPNLGARVFELDGGRLTAHGPLLLVDAADVTVTAPPET
jgi:broad specificity phosphatase PhoE